MADNWDIELAKKFKERNNRQRIGNVIGKVISTFPNFKISILDGQVVLDKNQLYISSLLEDNYKREFEVNNIEGATSNTSEHSHSIESLKGVIKFTDSLKLNDEVLLIPAENEQVWFIVGKVRKLG